MNVHVGHIARWQATLGGFAAKPTPSPPHLVASDSDVEDDDDDDDDDGDDDDASDDDGDASSIDEMTLYPLSLVTKRGSSFGYKSSHS